MKTCRMLLLFALLMVPGCGGLFNGTIVGDVYETASQFSNSSAGENWFSFTINGGIYSHTVQPLTINRELTEVDKGVRKAVGRVNQFQYPATAVLTIRTGKNGLGDVAKEHGISTIYYADVERWSALFGLWSMEKVHIYGH